MATVCSLQSSTDLLLPQWSSSTSPSNISTVVTDLNAHLHSRKSAHCSQKVALNISTNVIRSPIHLQSGKHPRHHPHLRVSPLKKATATVSLSSATASATSALLPSPDGLPECVPVNSIPFPSAPIEFPAPRDEFVNDADDESGLPIACDPKGVSETSVPERKSDNQKASHVNMRRRRAKSCVLSTHGQGDDTSHARRSLSPHPLIRFPNNSVLKDPSHTKSPPRGKRVRLSSTSTPKLSKRAKKMRKLVADMDFTSMMHRSMSYHLRSLMLSNNRFDDYMDESKSSRGVSLEQDFILVGRLWRGLVDQGYKHVLAQDASPASFLTDMIDSDGSDSPFIDHNESSLTSSTTIQDNKVPDEILTVSQLVANLILRANDRRGTRPRSSSRKSSTLGKTSSTRMRSPLHQVVMGIDVDEN